MIGVIFDYSGDKVEVRVTGNQVLFRTNQTGSQFTTIEGLKLDYKGVCREHPDLEKKENWKGEAIKRFKEKIKSYDTEEQKINYIINDLKKFGYIPCFIQKAGHRIKKIS